MHPDQIQERMELVLLRAIYLEAKLKPLANDTSKASLFKLTFPKDTVLFDFNLINQKESNLTFERQRELLLKMDKNKTIDITWDEAIGRDWETLTRYHISVNLGVLDERYSLLSTKHPSGKAFLWYRAPDFDDIFMESAEITGFSIEGTYEVGPLKASDGILFKHGKVWKLDDRFKYILIYLMKNRGFRSYRGIFIDMYPTRRQEKKSIDNIGKYVNATKKILENNIDELEIIQSKRYDSKDPNSGPLSGCELVLKKKRVKKSK